MRQETINIYDFAELSDGAKAKVMTDYKNIGESRIRKMQRKRNSKRIDLEFVTVAVLIFLGMTALVINW